LLSIEKDPVQMSIINVKAHVEEKYRLAGYSDEKIKKLMDTKADASDELISEAKKAIELILEGKPATINFGATTGYLQYISDWILDNSDDLKPEMKAILEKYFNDHVGIAAKNAEQKQFNEQLLMGAITATPTQPGAKPVVENTPLPAKPIV